MNTTWSRSFTVYPENCNPIVLADGKLCIHGGDLTKEMDRTAAECVRRFLYASDADSARTVAVDDMTFTQAARLGDLITIHASIVSAGRSRVGCQVVADIESKEGSKQCSAATFYFCAFKNNTLHPHGLEIS